MKKFKKILITALSLVICFQVLDIFNVVKAYANDDEILTNDGSDVNLEEGTGASEEGATESVGGGEDSEESEDPEKSENPEINLMPSVGLAVAPTVSAPKAPMGGPMVMNSSPAYNIVINEFLPNPSSGPDWFELKNLTDSTFSLTGYYFDDDITLDSDSNGIIDTGGGDPGANPIDLVSYSIPADGYLYINVGDMLNLTSDTPSLIKWNNPGEELIDSKNYSSNPGTDHSLGRYPDGIDHWETFDIPTPGSANYLGAPTVGIVNDGPDTGIDIDYSKNNILLSANWSGFIPAAPIIRYEYASRRSADDYYWNSTVRTWQLDPFWHNNNLLTAVSIPIDLDEEEYYFSVKAVYPNLESGVADSDGVTIDITPPDSQSIIINDGDKYTNSVDVKVKVSAIDNISGVEEVLLLEDQLTWMIYPYISSEIDYSLNNSTNEEKIIYAKFRDAVNNESSIISDSIILDTQPPTQPILNAKPGDGYIDLSWTEAIDNNEIDHYDIYKSGSPYRWIAKRDADIFEYRDEDVKNGENYTYSVIAVDKAGNPEYKPGIWTIDDFVGLYGSDPITVTPSKISEVVGQILESAAKTESVGFIPVAQAAPAEEVGEIKGEEAIETVPQTESPKEEKEEAKNWPMIIAILIAALIIVAGIWYYWVVTRPAGQYSVITEPKSRRKSHRKPAKRPSRRVRRR